MFRTITTTSSSERCRRALPDLRGHRIKVHPNYRRWRVRRMPVHMHSCGNATRLDDNRIGTHISNTLRFVPLAVYSVVLPRHEAAASPDRCVVCNADHPGSWTRIIARDNLNGRLLWLGWFSARIPCCPACGVRLQLWRAWDFCRTLIIGGASCVFGMIYLLPRLEG